MCFNWMHARNGSEVTETKRSRKTVSHYDQFRACCITRRQIILAVKSCAKCEKMSEPSSAPLHYASAVTTCGNEQFFFALSLSRMCLQKLVPAGITFFSWDEKGKKKQYVTLQLWKCIRCVLRSERCRDNHIYSWIWLCPKWAANALENGATICAHCGWSTWAEWL